MADNNQVIFTRKPELNRPILVEGLPGVGQVGKIAARYLIKELKAKKFARLYSTSFPAQAIIRESGIIQSMKNEFYYWKSENEEQKDLIIVSGNTQSTTPEGQYTLANSILDVASEFRTDTLYTLGGLGAGRAIDKPKVFGAITKKNCKSLLEKRGVELKREGLGQIIGISGVLLTMGRLRNMRGACLMGETPGFYPDPSSSKAVLEVLTDLLGIEIDMSRISNKIKEAEKKENEAHEMERKMMEDMGMIQKEPTEEEMRYIG